MSKAYQSHQEFLVALGKKLATLRMEKGISQEALAHAADLHRAYVGKIERGEVNVTTGTLFKLAEALDLELEVGLC